jgi:SAM-dependent methyltransferase
VSRFEPELFALQPWYHDFSSLGFDTTFLEVPLTPRERLLRALDLASGRIRRILPGPRTTPVPRGQVRSIRGVFRRVPTSHQANQPIKETHLLALIDQALSHLPSSSRCLELFSADGYYSCRIKKRQPAATVTGIELDPDHVERATTIARVLGLQGITFRHEDVWLFLDQAWDAFDLVLCAGGLYHLSDPGRLLESVDRVSRGYVVIQSVVTLETEDPHYFVQPAPGWQHGCRFTHAWLRERIDGLGWRVVAESRAELPGNANPTDRGSSFFLCQVR